MRRRSLFLAAWLLGAASAADMPVRTTYKVKQVASGTVYLDGGSNDGLAEGMRLKVLHLTPGDALINRKEIGTIAVIAVAGNSAACESRNAGAPIQTGDTAELYESDAQVLAMARASSGRRSYAQVVSFSDGDPLEDELREYVPRPPLPEVNRARGRIGFEQNAILDHTSGTATYQEGLVLRADMTRLGGSYWNFTGYWRGRLSSRSNAGPQTLNDLLNRTYQIGLYYDNPKSRYVAGFGRLLLPWANSLNTIDGGYVGRRIGRETTVGAFAGTTPDPTAWDYDPSRQIAGSFVSFEHGSYETVRFISTAGAAITRSHWHPERQFLFFENTLLFGTKVSIYHNLEADRLAKPLAPGSNGPRLARSFLTLRLQPSRVLAIDFSHNYFRDVPTFDTRLIGTGLLDKFLFQGVSAGFRLELPYRTTLYTSIGRSKRDQDARSALNYMGGLTFASRRYLPFRTDLRYSQFNSSFGRGGYRSISFSRELGEKFRFELQGGEQTLRSAFTHQGRARFVDGTLDYLIGAHYVLGGGYSVYRGSVQSYDQLYFNLGYRF